MRRNGKRSSRKVRIPTKGREIKGELCFTFEESKEKENLAISSFVSSLLLAGGNVKVSTKEKGEGWARSEDF